MNLFIPLGAIIGFLILIDSNSKKVRRMLSDASRNRLKQIVSSKYPVIDFKNWTVVGIRGMLPDEKGNLIPNDNKTNEWNDCLILIKGNESKAYQATVDPGSFWLNNPMKGLEKVGTARQEPQLMNMIFSPIKGKPALLIESLLIRRDSNRNGIHEEKDLVYKADLSNGIFIHAKYTDGKVERNSAGCAVLNHRWNSPEWKEFYNTLSMSGQKKIKYVLLDGRKV